MRLKIDIDKQSITQLESEAKKKQEKLNSIEQEYGELRKKFEVKEKLQ